MVPPLALVSLDLVLLGDYNAVVYHSVPRCDARVLVLSQKEKDGVKLARPRRRVIWA